jgi:hypothetical protein
MQKKREICVFTISSADNMYWEKIHSFYTLSSAAAITAAADNFVTFFLFIIMAK